MKIIAKTITIAAMLTSTSAFACDFIPGGSISNEMASEFVTNVQAQDVSTIGQAAPDLMRGVIGGKSAETMASLPEGCGTIEAFVNGFYSVNGFAANDPITSLSGGFRLPAISVAPVSKPEIETSKPVMVADDSATEYVQAEVPAVEIAPVQEPVKQVAAPVREAVVTPQNVLAQINANKEAIAAYQAQPVADRSPETDAAIAELKGRLDNALSLLNQLPKDAQGQIDLAKLTPTQVVQAEQVVAEVQETSSLVESYIGRSMLDWITVGNTAGFLFLFALLVFGYRRLNGRIDQKANNDYVAGVSARVQDIEDRDYNVSVSKITEGAHRTVSAAEMRDMAVGTTFDYFLRVDGKIARYEVVVSSKTENEKDVMLTCQQISSGVTSKKFHPALAARIEKNEGSHPFVALLAA